MGLITATARATRVPRGDSGWAIHYTGARRITGDLDPVPDVSFSACALRRATSDDPASYTNSLLDKTTEGSAARLYCPNGSYSRTHRTSIPSPPPPLPLYLQKHLRNSIPSSPVAPQKPDLQIPPTFQHRLQNCIMMKPRSASRPPKSPTSQQSALPTITSTTTTTRLPRSISTAKPLSLRRLRVLYADLKARDAKSRYPWRTLVLVFLAFVLLSIVQFILSATWGVMPFQVRLPAYSVYDRYDDMFYSGSDFAYIPESKIFMTTTAKVGSTTLWTWLHKGLTGSNSTDACKGFRITNFDAPCWQGKVLHPHNMTDHERWSVLQDPKVLRIAITRNPFERILSAWKSKAACESDDFGTNVKERDVLIPGMLRQAQMRKGASCLSITSFAEVLDKLRRMAEQGEFDMKLLDRHFRPQEFHFGVVNYQYIMDVKMLNNVTALQPIAQRMPYPDLITEAPTKLSLSRPVYETLSEPTAALLYKFAILTEKLPSDVRIP